MRTLFVMGFRNDFGAMGQSEEDEFQSLQQYGGGTLPPTTTTTTSSGSTDWAKLFAEGLKSGGDIYGSYTQEQIAKLKLEAEKLKLKQTPGAVAPGSSIISPNTLFIAGAVGVVGLILALTLK